MVGLSFNLLRSDCVPRLSSRSVEQELDLWLAGIAWESPEWWLIEGYVGIQTAVNPGALFGFGGRVGKSLRDLFRRCSDCNHNLVVRIPSCSILVDHHCISSDLGWLDLRQMYDRVGMWQEDWMPKEWSSGVRDWILFRYKEYTWPNFNIADSLLVCGTIVLGWRSLFYG